MAYSSRPYLSVKKLAEYLAFEGTDRGKQSAARAWIDRTGIRKYWRGKTYVVHPDDVDASLRGEMPRTA